MPILILTNADTGLTIPVSGLASWTVYGTDAPDTIEIAAGTSAIVNGGAGIDLIHFLGDRGDYSVALVGTSAVFTHTATGKTTAVPVNAAGDSVRFGNGAAVTLSGSSASNVMLGTENIAVNAVTPINNDIGLLDAQSKSATISGIDYDTLVPLDNYILATLYEGASWLNFQSVSDPITYSFNETLPLEYKDKDTIGWKKVTLDVRPVVDEVMSITDGIILPDIENVSSGQIRFNMVETESGVAAYAYYPSSDVRGGDVFLGLDIGSDLESGSVELYGIGRSNIVHELGHALGLTHPFEGASVLPANEDHTANTVMSYTDFRMVVLQFTGTQTESGSKVEVAEDLVAPDQFMPYDIAALQAIYGPDTNYRASDNTYTFGDVPFYTTIWDAGGNDILDLSATGYYNVIDLTPGSHSNINYRDIDTQIADQQAVYQDLFGTSHYDSWVSDVFTSRSSDIYTGENALGIAWGVIIEKVTGGSAGNRITDNAVDNYLTGGAANDLFYLGAGGFDTVVGGGGYDLVMLEQYTMDQVELGSHEDSLLLAAAGFAVQMVGIAGVQFADQLYTVA